MAARGFTYYSVGRQAGTPMVAATSVATPTKKLKKS